jgi:hypothetical protein
MAVDTRLLSYWKVAQALRTCEREDDGWTAQAMPDAYTALLRRLEQMRTPLHVVPHDGPVAQGRQQSLRR